MEAHELETVRANLTNLTANLIAAAGGEGLDRFGLAVARGSKMPLDRLRAWTIMSGFEPNPSTVLALNTLISARRERGVRVKVAMGRQQVMLLRWDVRRGWKECVSTCRSRW